MSGRVAICSGCGPFPAEEFGNHVCKPKPLQQQLAEMRERNRLRGNMFTDWIDPEKALLIDTLQAILDIEKSDQTAVTHFFLATKRNLLDGTVASPP